jgi:hypothetical protein
LSTDCTIPDRVLEYLQKCGRNVYRTTKRQYFNAKSFEIRIFETAGIVCVKCINGGKKMWLVFL